ncbi:ATP-binding cassette domain-containing protein [Anaerocolumna sp.]|uniref:ATP-binding cassette domain-containing protein n=1 Tax=Anaerocolumna sp. TaxID=2041569 RepID=UPI0028A967EE|nr:ATP-binding cassette domain-containing protein [Anaerocolumna sp.]
MIQIDGLNKSYGKKNEIEVLKNISLTIKDGEVIALLGHNGSGKSTLIKCLVGVLKPSKGTIKMDGYTTFKNRKKIVPKLGVVFNQKPSFIVDLNVYDNLLYFKVIYNINDNDFNDMLQLIDNYLNIKSLYNKPYRKLSFGERVKCEITSVLLHKPKYILLDEPTIGLDYNAKKGLYQLLDYIKKNRNATIIIITHEVDYIEGICDRAIILNHGEVRYDGIPQKFGSYLNQKTLINIEYNYIIDEEMAECIFKESNSVDKIKKVFTYICSHEEDKNSYIKRVVEAFSIKLLGTKTTSLREVLEDVLDEIEGIK